MDGQFEWTFPSAHACELKGLNDSGVETFKDDTISSLAREICQNSLDAAVTAKGEAPTPPVEVEFSLFDLPRSDFPAASAFKDALDRTKSFWRENEQAMRFLSEMERVFSERTYVCLRISDYGTKGLHGVGCTDRSKASDWRSLVMSSGVSDKNDASGGSFGIGKYAAFSCSNFRTVFYATQTASGESGFQGVSRLLSFEDEYGETTLGTGYLGAGEAKPVPRWLSLESAYERTKPGTDIFIPAFVGGDSFRSDIVKSVLEGFLYAIHMKRLVVRILDDDGRLELDKSWLIRAERENNPLFECVRDRYRALTRPEKNWKTLDLGERGKIRLSLIADKNLDKRVAMVRQPGMQIFQKDHFRSHISFTGIAIVEGYDLNCALKRFENPQHTKWERKRDPQNAGLLDEIFAFCRDSVGVLTKENLGVEIDAGLGDILPDLGAEGDPRKEEVLDVKVKGIVVTEKPAKRHRRGAKPHLGGAPTGEKSGTDTHDGKRPKPVRPDDGKGGQKNVRRHDIDYTSFRSVCRGDKTQGTYTLKIVPAKSAEKAAVDVIAVAEIKDYPAPIKSAALADGTPLAVKGAEISGLVFEKDVPVKIDLTLDYHDYVSLEVACYEYK